MAPSHALGCGEDVNAVGHSSMDHRVLGMPSPAFGEYPIFVHRKHHIVATIFHSEFDRCAGRAVFDELIPGRHNRLCLRIPSSALSLRGFTLISTKRPAPVSYFFHRTPESFHQAKEANGVYPPTQPPSMPNVCRKRVLTAS